MSPHGLDVPRLGAEVRDVLDQLVVSKPSLEQLEGALLAVRVRVGDPLVAARVVDVGVGIP